MSWLSQGIAEIGNVWNSQPNWAKGLEIGGAAALTGGVGLGLAGIGPAAGLFGADAATTGGIDAVTTGAAVDAAGAGGGAGAYGLGGAALGLDPSVLGTGGLADAGGGGLADAGGAGGFQTLDASGNPITIPQGLQANAGVPATGGTGTPFGAATSSPDSFDTWGIPDITGGDAPPQNPWSLGGIGSSLTKGLTPATALGAAAGLGGLGYNLYQGYEQKQQLNQIQAGITQQAQQAQQAQAATQAAAGPELASGEALQSYLTTGTLPQNAQAAVSQYVTQQKAAITQGYASRGMSADPNQNSALQGDLAKVDQDAQILTQQLQTQYFNAGSQAIQAANQLIASGLNATQVSAQTQIAMQQLDLQMSNATTAAITSFAKGLTPLGGGQQQFTLQPAQQAA